MSSEEVLVERMTNLRNWMEEKFVDNNKITEAILEQTKATNGKVAEINEWKIKVNTVLWVISAVISSICLPIVIFWIKSKLKI